MKKILYLFMIFFIMLSSAACGNSDTAVKNDGDKKTIGIALPT